MNKVYVDGQHGTTGLLVQERLSHHPLVEVLQIPYSARHDTQQRVRLLNQADIVFLCLPDQAAKESVGLIDNPTTKVIDASTAHRIDDEWVYGFPELCQAQTDRIRLAQRVSNPGCHATAAIAALRPLVDAGIMDTNAKVKLFSVTGYTGGGKTMIEKYETDKTGILQAPRQYSLALKHKHVPEIQKHSRLEQAPILMPVVSSYDRGLGLTLPLYLRELKSGTTAEDLIQVYQETYSDCPFIRVHPFNDQSQLIDQGFDLRANNNTNYLDVFVYGNQEQVQILTRIDNLGKGASGAAIQNMNIMLGLDPATGL